MRIHTLKKSNRSTLIVPILGVLATLLGLGLYWYALLADYDSQREQARTHVTQLASQTAQARR